MKAVFEMIFDTSTLTTLVDLKMQIMVTTPTIKILANSIVIFMCIMKSMRELGCETFFRGTKYKDNKCGFG